MARFIDPAGGGLLPATSTLLGGVKAGPGAVVAPDGTLSVTATPLGPSSGWDTLTNYGIAGTQVVYHNGSTYVSLAPSGPGTAFGPQEPSAATPTYWQPAALEGDVGPIGPTNDDALLLTFFLMT
jgi:hypothetical protein